MLNDFFLTYFRNIFKFILKCHIVIESIYMQLICFIRVKKMYIYNIDLLIILHPIFSHRFENVFESKLIFA